jgi:hypothetical protein
MPYRRRAIPRSNAKLSPSGLAVDCCSRVKTMSDAKYLTVDEVVERYRGEVSAGTLRNWRAQRVGAPFIKIGKSVLYPVQGLDEWDKMNLVICRASRKLIVSASEGE